MDTPPQDPSSGEDAAGPPRRTRRWPPLVLAALAAGGLVGLLTGVLSASSPGQEIPPQVDAMMAVAPGGPVELSEVPEATAALYVAAQEHEDVFAQIPCYCGCEEFLDHRHLLDCFVRPDGGWERHAMGCAVCVAEARDVLDGLDAGDTTAEIRAAIDGRFGAITPGA